MLRSELDRSGQVNTFRVDSEFTFCFGADDECVQVALVLEERSGGVPRPYGSGADGISPGTGMV